MTMKNVNPTTTQAWGKLEKHYNEAKDLELKSLFRNDNERSEKFTINVNDFEFDFSRNRITEETLSHLLELAEESHLKDAMDAYFGGATQRELAADIRITRSFTNMNTNWWLR